MTIEQLQAPRAAGLVKGQKVRVEGYFWQYLDYNPFMVPEYLELVRRPLAASRRRWAALYATSRMQGYYDRLALTPEQQRDWPVRRLEHVRIYGDLAQLPFGLLYLRAWYMQPLDEAQDPFPQRAPAAAVQGRQRRQP